jgi:protein-tyrosine phosphatase
MEAIEYHRFPIRDRSLPSSLNQIYAIMNILEASHARNRISAVHCRGGIGRTGLVIGCWLVQSGLAADGEEALQIIAKEWKGVEKCTRFPHSPETGEQEMFVRNWKVGAQVKGVMGVGSGVSVTGGIIRMIPAS